jgi:hypothetical protein
MQGAGDSDRGSLVIGRFILPYQRAGARSQTDDDQNGPGNQIKSLKISASIRNVSLTIAFIPDGQYRCKSTVLAV